jgi:hypothetical protein
LEKVATPKAVPPTARAEQLLGLQAQSRLQTVIDQQRFSHLSTFFFSTNRVLNYRRKIRHLADDLRWIV